MKKRKGDSSNLKKLDLMHMPMPPERSSKSLHNFSFPYLKWGSQKFLRCMKISPHSSNKLFHFPSEIVTDDSPALNRNQDSKLEINVRDRRNAVGECTEGCEEDSASAAVVRPWNLRTRRAACKAPREEKKIELGSSPLRCEKKKEDEKWKEKEKAIELPMFSISLSKQEVEEDFAAMVGTRPPRRPKKRPKIVQKHLDSFFPGLWLTEVTLDSYKVSDTPDS